MDSAALQRRPGDSQPLTVIHRRHIQEIHSHSPLFSHLLGVRGRRPHYSALSSHDLAVTPFAERRCRLSTSAPVSCQFHQTRRKPAVRGERQMFFSPTDDFLFFVSNVFSDWMLKFAVTENE